MPTSSLSRTPEIPGLDKFIHAFLFSVLAFLWLFDHRRLGNWPWIIAITIVYGVLIEMLQEAMHWGRSGEWLDLVLDFSGSLLGLLFYTVYSRCCLRVKD